MVVLVVPPTGSATGSGGQSSRFGPAPSPLITAGGGSAGMSGTGAAGTGTVTGATYDFSVNTPAPTDSLDRRIKAFLGDNHPSFFGRGGDSGISGSPGIVAIYELLS